MACIDKTTTRPSRKGHKLTQLFARFVIYILKFIATVGSNFLHASQISAQSPKVHSKTGPISNTRFFKNLHSSHFTRNNRNNGTKKRKHHKTSNENQNPARSGLSGKKKTQQLRETIPS